jgi:hypothetical protein
MSQLRWPEQVLNSDIFDQVLRLAAAGVAVGAEPAFPTHSLELAFAAVDILLQCIVQQDVRAQLGETSLERAHSERCTPPPLCLCLYACLCACVSCTHIPGAGIKGVLQTLLFGRDFGLAVASCKGLIALSGLNEHSSVQPMTFRKAVKMVVLLRVFTRVRRRKGKGLVANSESKTPQPNVQRTMRVI